MSTTVMCSLEHVANIRTAVICSLEHVADIRTAVVCSLEHVADIIDYNHASSHCSVSRRSHCFVVCEVINRILAIH